MARTEAPVFLSLQHLDPEWVHLRFPTIAAACKSVGLDLAQNRIPVGPAAHYVMGGVETDIWGRSTLPGLYAAGEVACTGVHGANRLASNSLLEGLVFGARAAQAMLQPSRSGGLVNVRVAARPEPPAQAPGEYSDNAVRSLMWNAVGLIRHADTLGPAVDRLGAWRQESGLALVSYLIARAALDREESRGGHFRADFPARDDVHWKFHLGGQRHGR
jgi:L-aspartate oxidase